MVAVNSTMLPLGTTAPDFWLPDTQFLRPDTDGRMTGPSNFKGQPLLVAFICNHCPFVKHIRAGLAQLARDYQPRRVAVVAINSNDVENYPDDAPDKMKAEVKGAGYSVPVSLR